MTLKRIKDTRLQKWREREREREREIPKSTIVPSSTQSKNLQSGFSSTRRKWVTLNRAGAKVGRTWDNLQITSKCLCGVPNHTMTFITLNCPIGPIFLNTGLKAANDTALQWVEIWCDKI